MSKPVGFDQGIIASFRFYSESYKNILAKICMKC